MNYFISRQYLKDKPVYFGVFSSEKFAREMADIKIRSDESVNEKIVYRIYHHEDLIFEHNKWDVRSVDAISYHPKTFKYKVYQMISKNEFVIIANLDHASDAKDFITHRLSDDANNHLDRTYRLYHLYQLISEHNQSTRSETQSQDKSLAFRPTPLPTKPSLGPRTYLVQPDEDKDQNKD